MNKNKLYQPILWGLLHGLNDCIAGYMLANYAWKHSSGESLTMLVTYAILGFGGQLPVALLLDRLQQIKPFAILSVSFLLLSAVLYSFEPGMAIILTGMAGSGVHVTGGVICLQGNEKAGPLGLFTAPGVIGLALGGLLGTQPGFLIIITGLLLLLSIAILRRIPVYQVRNASLQPILDTHDYVMLGLLLLMCFRSFIFDVMNAAAVKFEHGILVFGLSAFAGKIIGGMLADRIGWKKFVYITLPLAFLLFNFGRDNMYAIAFGIACLQSSVPLTLLLMSRSIPRFPATATAFSLGTSVALAGLPLYFNNSMHSSSFDRTWFYIFIAMVLTWALLLWIRRSPKLRTV